MPSTTACPNCRGRAVCWIAPDAHVIGRVRRGCDVGVWFGAVLRGDDEPVGVGDRSNVQEGAALHTDPGFPLTVGPDVTVGHRAILHGCTVGAVSLIGMGTTVLDGARVGERCWVGAGAPVTEGKVFPDDWPIVDSPAKAVCERDASAFEALRRSVDVYAAKWHRFAAGLRRIG